MISLLFHERILPPWPENAGVTRVFLHAQSSDGRLSRHPYLYKHCLNLSSKFIRTVLAIEGWRAKPLKWPPGLSLRFPSLPSATHNSKTEQLWSSRGVGLFLFILWLKDAFNSFQFLPSVEILSFTRMSLEGHTSPT